MTKRTLAVIALTGAAVMSASGIAGADTRDAQPPHRTSTAYLVYPHQGAFPPGILPAAAALPAVALLGVNPLGVL